MVQGIFQLTFTLPDFSCGYAGDYAHCRHVPGNNAIGGNHSPSMYRYAGQDGYSGSNPNKNLNSHIAANSCVIIIIDIMLKCPDIGFLRYINIVTIFNLPPCRPIKLGY